MAGIRVQALLASIAITAMLPWPERVVPAEPTSRGAAIKRIVYMYSVAEYRGLDSWDVYDGYRREQRDLTRRGRLPESTVRWLRIRGSIAADLEYGNRGLGGFRNWSRTEGIEAAEHFAAIRKTELNVGRERGLSPQLDAE